MREGTRDVGSVRGSVLRVNAARALAVFFGTGGLLSLLVVALPHDRALLDAPVLATGAAALTMAALLLAWQRASAPVLGGCVGLGSVLIAGLVVCGRGADVSMAFAGFTVWVIVYAAVFFTGRHAVAQAAFTITGISAAWSTTTRPWQDLVLVVVTAASTGVMVSRLVREVRDSVSRDPSTGLLSPVGLARDAAAVLAQAQAAGKPVAAVVLQLRGLDEVSASLGHGAAESLVVRAATRLLEQTTGASLLGRLAGNRLVVLMSPASLADHQTLAAGRGLPCAQPLDGARHAGAAARTSIRGPHTIAGVPMHLEAHLGIALTTQLTGPDAVGEDLPGPDGPESTAPGGVTDPADRALVELLRAAETALAVAERRGTDLEVYDPAMTGGGREQLQLLAELRDGVPAGQLRVHYQPQVDAWTRQVTGVEALVRWQHPVRGLLPPGMFLPVAETTDLIVDLTWAVLDDALRQCAAWLTAGLRVPVSVNLSARLLADPSLPEHVQALLRAHSVPAQLLTLEVTETALVAHPVRAARLLAALRATGARLSLDDFGTGATSLTLLAEVAFDELKVDRSFVAAGPADPRAAAIVRGVIDLGRSLGQTVVAEGVEDERTAQWLTGLGCHQLQGYHHGRPQPAGELTGLPVTGTHHDPAAARTAGRPPVLPELWEAARLAALHALAVLDTPPDVALDDLATLAAQVCGTPMAHVSLVDADRVWLKASAGGRPAGTQVPRSQAFCAHALARTDLLEVPDALADPRFAGNPAVLGDPHVRFYAGAPLLTADGHTLGTLCVLDTEPRHLTASQRTGLHTLARDVVTALHQQAPRP